MKPTAGRIVHYKLSDQDAKDINRRRDDFAAFSRAFPPVEKPGTPGASGHVGHYGNHVSEGDVFPAMVVKVWAPDQENPPANLQVHLDGNDTYWATSRYEGDEPWQWSWPPREPQ